MNEQEKMKTILVDAIDAFIDREGIVSEDMHRLLEHYPNEKIILTSADDSQFETFSLGDAPYEVFTLKHNPEKSDPLYYRTMLAHYGLKSAGVIYFEHDMGAVTSARSEGIVTHFYDSSERDLTKLQRFIEGSL